MGLDSENLRYYARIGVAFIIAIIVLALFFGRTIQVKYQSFLFLIPFVGLIAVVGLLTSALLRIRKNHTRRSRIVLVARIVPALIICGFSVAWCEYLIDLPIERIHFIKYGALAVCLYCSHYTRMTIRCVAQSLAMGIAVGILDELAQYYIPNRVFDYRDIFLNVSATVAGTATVLSLDWGARSKSLTGQFH